MPFDIIIINPNNFSVSDYISSKINYDDIIDFLKDHTTIVNVSTTNDMIGTIVNTLDLTQEIPGNTTTIFESTNYIIQMCHLLDDTENIFNKPINEIANVYHKGLTQPEKKDIIKGSVVCMKSKINQNDLFEVDSLTINELATLLYRNCVKRGIVLNKNSIDEFEYVSEPIEFMTLDEKLNTKFFEFNVSEYIIKVFIEIKPSFDSINEPLSALFGRHNVYGRGFITQQNVDGRFVDLNIDTFKKLLYVLSDRQKKDTDEKTKDTNNFYRLIDKKYNKFKKENPFKKYLFEDCGQHERPSLNQLVQLQLEKNNN
jgi:hypothetical protein